MGADTGKCDVCGKACQWLESKTNPKASEFYCSKCHKSYVPEVTDEDDEGEDE